MKARVTGQGALERGEEIRSRYAAIVECSHDAIVSRLDGVISAWNPAAQRMFGYTEQEAIGQPITMYYLRTCTRRSTTF